MAKKKRVHEDEDAPSTAIRAVTYRITRAGVLLGDSRNLPTWFPRSQITGYSTAWGEQRYVSIPNWLLESKDWAFDGPQL
jgi:hypothetical protein